MLVSVMKLQARITTQGFKVPGGGKWEMMRFGDSLWEQFVMRAGGMASWWQIHVLVLNFNYQGPLRNTPRNNRKILLSISQILRQESSGIYFIIIFLSLRAAALLPWHPHSRVIGIKPSYIKSYQTLLRFSTVQSSTGSLPGVKDELSPMWWVWLHVRKGAGGWARKGRDNCEGPGGRKKVGSSSSDLRVMLSLCREERELMMLWSIYNHSRNTTLRKGCGFFFPRKVETSLC